MINLSYLVESASAAVLPGEPLPSEDTPARIQDLTTIIGRVINIVVVVALIALVLMLVIGGFQYIFASGDAKSTAEARNRITWAFVGLAMVIIAWFLLLLVKEFTGIDVTNFDTLV